MSKPKIASGIARVTAFSIVLLGVLVTLLVSMRVSDAMQEAEQQRLETQTAIIVGEFRQYLQDRSLILQDHTRFAVMRQGVMQPLQMEGYVSDFMADLTVLGESYRETLVDLDGNTIYSTHSEPAADYRYQPWLIDFIDQNRSQLIRLSQYDERFFWQVVLPIRYLGSTEGALITEIPVQAINEQGKLSDSWQGISLVLRAGEQVVAEFGQVSAATRKLSLPWDDVGLVFEFSIDESELLKARRGLIYELVVLIALVSLVIVFIAFYWGKRSLVKPIQYLKQATEDMADGRSEQPLKEDLIWQETSLVAKGFNQMLQTIQQREQQLRNSNRELAQTNDELKHSQAQLVQSEKMAGLGTMAAGVAHEINNPVGFVKSNLSTMNDYTTAISQYLGEVNTVLQQDAIPDSIREQLKSQAETLDIDFLTADMEPLINESQEGVNRVADIVASLKSFARLDSAEMEMTDITDGIRETLKVVWNELKYHCTLHEEYATLPPIRCNLGQLNQVIMNLLLNAAQAIEDKGDIYLSTAVVADEIQIRVRDTGCGIPAEAVGRLFTPFYTTKPVGKGTGLGLSISHGIVEKHGGSINVESEPGKGACFIIRLPITGEHAGVKLDDADTEPTVMVR